MVRCPRAAWRRSSSPMALATHSPPDDCNAPVRAVTRPPAPRRATTSPSGPRANDTGPRLDAMTMGRLVSEVPAASGRTCSITGPSERAGERGEHPDLVLQLAKDEEPITGPG